MQRLSAFIIVALATPALASPFQVDLDHAEMRARLGLYTVQDLAVGETGIVTYPNFCELDGGLMMDATNILSSGASDYSMNYRVTRQPGGVVSITSLAGARYDRSPSEVIGLYFVDHMNCDDYNTPSNLLPVSTIDGAKSLSEIVNTQ